MYLRFSHAGTVEVPDDSIEQFATIVADKLCTRLQILRDAKKALKSAGMMKEDEEDELDDLLDDDDELKSEDNALSSQNASKRRGIELTLYEHTLKRGWQMYVSGMTERGYNYVSLKMLSNGEYSLRFSKGNPHNELMSKVSEKRFGGKTTGYYFSNKDMHELLSKFGTKFRCYRMLRVLRFNPKQ